MLKNLINRWSLNSLYEGESESPLLRENLDRLKSELTEMINRLSTDSQSIEPLPLIADVQHLQKRVRQKRFFVNCLTVQDTTDELAKSLAGEVQVINSQFNHLLIYFDEYLIGICEDDWAQLMEQDELKGVTFYLNERRQRAQKGLGKDKDILANRLMVNGYHAWGTMYRSITNYIKVPHKGKSLTTGQAYNQLLNGNKELRRSWDKQWDEQSNNIATVLNSLAGFRLDLYAEQGVDEVLSEPLHLNRLSEQSLNAMWLAVERKKAELLPYLDMKKTLLDSDTMDWYDFMAPLQFKGENINLDDAANLIVNSFNGLNEQLANFAKMAFEEQWIETESRPNKSAGAFCSPLPIHKESRIFMTFTGTPNNINALAHELGHGYHQYLIRHLPSFAQLYPMSIGESAAIFAELVVTRSLVKQAESKTMKIHYLENRINRGIRLLLLNYSIYLFEKRFYEKRKEGIVSGDELKDLMLQTQREIFNDRLDSYDPQLWMTRAHYYMTHQPFYNFPYTFGYLISQGMYEKVAADSENFTTLYEPFLMDTGRKDAEGLMAKYFNADLTKVSTWEGFIKPLIDDLAELAYLSGLD